MRGELFIRVIVAAILAIGGWRLGAFIGERSETTNELTWILALSIGAYISGFLLAPYVAIRPWRWARARMRSAPKLVPMQTFFAGAIGLAFALVITALLTLPLSMLPGRWGDISPLVAAIILILLFVPITVLQGPNVLQFFFSSTSQKSTGNREAGKSDLIILDTNAIIDGRIADIIQTGFIHGDPHHPRVRPR